MSPSENSRGIALDKSRPTLLYTSEVPGWMGVPTTVVDVPHSDQVVKSADKRNTRAEGVQARTGSGASRDLRRASREVRQHFVPANIVSPKRRS